MNKVRSSVDKRGSQLPSWLWANSSVLPSVYSRIWDAVKEDRSLATQSEVLVDTNKVFPLLLTSQLPTEVLGYIWGLANQKYAGKLTEQELYVVLALVAVAQTSHPFSSLDVLHLLPGPPAPRLNLASIYPNVPQVAVPFDPVPDFQDSLKNHHPPRCQRKVGASPAIAAPVLPGLVPNNLHMGETKIDSKNPIVLSKPAGPESFPESNRVNPLEPESKPSTASSSYTDSGDDFSEFQSCPIPQVQPSVSIWDTKQGSAIGSRLANHNLGVKKTAEKTKRISSSGSGKIQGGSQIRAPPGSADVALKPSAAIKESSVANERLGEMLFPKCSLKTTSKMVILKDTAIRNNSDPPKQIVVNVREKSMEKIPSLAAPTFKNVSNSTSAASRDSKNTAQDLMNLQQVEDKYSALRILVPESNVPQPAEESNFLEEPGAPNQSDEFGDFVSAEQSETAVPSVVALSQTEKSDFDYDDSSDHTFTDFDGLASQCVAKKTGDTSIDATTNRDFGNADTGAVVDPQCLDEKYNGILETEKVVPKEDALSINSVELGNGTFSVITRSNSVPSLDLKSFLSPGVEDEQQQLENMHQLIYWEWKRYMESCVFVLQTAANVFTGITSDSVLQQVLASARGYNFLCNLAEVAAVCRRVNFSHKEMDINIMGFDDLLMDIDRIWAEMEPFYASIPIVTELPVWPLHQNESATCCALCLTVVTSGRIVYNDNCYHVTCANLWLNCVNGNLPVLRYPTTSFISQQHSVPISSTGGSQI